LYVSSTATLTHYAVHLQCGTGATIAIGILPRFAGISVHDGWAPYWTYGCRHTLMRKQGIRILDALESVFPGHLLAPSLSLDAQPE